MSINAAKVAPSLNTRFISHGTLGCHNLEKSRQFYEEFLGLETTQTSPISLMIRLGSNHVYAVVQVKNKTEMPRHYHNGLDVENSEDVDTAYQTVQTEAEKWGLYNTTRPVEQHGTYSFMFWDMDGNCWEILSNPPGVYIWIFEQGDLEGRGHFERGFYKKRPDQINK
ncbi:MAG: VOC family protein [Pseudomonadota bacterium]|nr:VOC family protein [Pseudomonadota bacterium]